MATYILRLKNTNIIGGRVAIDNAVIPSDSVKVTKAVFDLYELIKSEMRADGRNDRPIYINNTVEKPVDTRPEVSMTFDKIAYNINSLATLTVDILGNNNYSENRIHQMFNSHYLLQFSNGEVTRNDIGFIETGDFEIKSTPNLKISNPQTITIYR